MEIDIYGLSRSGNHAIIFWIIHNITDEITEIKDQVYTDSKNKICFINNEKIYSTEFRKNFDFKKYENIIRSYEDTNVINNKHKSFIILRDFLNLICSRYKLYHKMLGYNKDYCTGIQDIIYLWKRHCESDRKILYNRWVLSKFYRDSVCEKIGLKNKKDKINYVSNIGNGSSFGGVKLHQKEEYFKRHEKIKLPKEIVEIILDDFELIKLNKDIFDINLYDLKSL